MVNASLVENILMLTKKAKPASQIHVKQITFVHLKTDGTCEHCPEYTKVDETGKICV